MNVEQLSHLTPTMSVLVGIVLLLFGRKLFWFFVAVIGFLFGMALGAQFFTGIEPWIVLIVSIGIGLLSAVLAIVLQKVAIILAGGVAGGLGAMYLAANAGLASPWPMLAFLLAGLLAAILSAVLFEWALIILSALIGASLIVTPLPLADSFQLLLWLTLFAVGLGVQMAWRARSAAATID